MRRGIASLGAVALLAAGLTALPATADAGRFTAPIERDRHPASVEGAAMRGHHSGLTAEDAVDALRAAAHLGRLDRGRALRPYVDAAVAPRTPATIPTITSPVDGATVSGQVGVDVASTAIAVKVQLGPLTQVAAVDGGAAHLVFDTYGLLGGAQVSAFDCDDAQGADCNGAGASVAVTVSNAAPTLTAPAGGAVVSMHVNAAATAEATAVAFVVDGTQVAYDGAAPFEAAISTDPLSLGQHRIWAVNCDQEHNCATNNPSNKRSFTVADRLYPRIRRIAPDPFNPVGPARVARTVVSYSVDVPSDATLVIARAGGGAVLRRDLGHRRPGLYSFKWDGRTSARKPARSGRYVVSIDTTTSGTDAVRGHASSSVRIDSTPARVGGVRARPATFNPIRDHYKDSVVIGGRLSEDVAAMTLKISAANGQTVRSIALGAHRSGSFAVRWNGRTASGRVVPAGRYNYRFLTRDRLGNTGQSVPHRVAVSDKHLVRHTFTTTVSAKASFRSNLSGACSGVFSPGERGWADSAGYYSDYYCVGSDAGGVAAAVHQARVPRAMRYGQVRISAYGGSANGLGDVAAIILVDRRGHLSDAGRGLGPRVGPHRGPAADGEDMVTGGGLLRWLTGTVDANWFDVKDYTVTLKYSVLT
jgi:flagellar hook assembly protein FlgD